MYDYNLAILFDYFVDYELLKMLRIFQTNKYILSLTCFKRHFHRTLNFINQSALLRISPESSDITLHYPVIFVELLERNIW